MKMLSASTLAALALGLMLSGSAVYAADNGGQQGKQETQDPNDQKARDHHGKPPAKVETDKPGKQDVNTDRQTNRHNRNNMRAVDQNNPNTWNNRNVRRAVDDAKTNDTNNGDHHYRTNADQTQPENTNNRNNANNNGDRHNRHNADMSRWHRNFDAPRQFHAGSYRAPRGYNYRRWGYGQRLPRDYYARDFWLSDFVTFGLLSPPEGFVWVRYGPDALLVDEETGEIIQVEYNVFYS